MDAVFWATLIDFIIAMGYITFAIVIVALLGYRLYHWGAVSGMAKYTKFLLVAALTATFMFLVGCAGSHFEMVAHYNSYPQWAEKVAPHMIVVGIPQVIGVWGPVLLASLLNNEFTKATRREKRRKSLEEIHDDGERFADSYQIDSTHQIVTDIASHLEEELMDRDEGVRHRSSHTQEIADDKAERKQEREDDRAERKQERADDRAERKSERDAE